MAHPPTSPNLIWRERELSPAALAAVEACPEAQDLPPLVRRLIAKTGVTDPEAISHFLTPRLDQLSDPFALPQMKQATARLWRAIDQQEKIVLYGDYDVDGVTSLTILHEVLTACGATVSTFLPHRLDEGYGMSVEGVKRCCAEHQPHLIVAVDCGTNSALEIQALHAHGIDVIVLDHHECPPGGPPECVAVVNPKLGDTFHYLCSAGLAFKLAHALMKERRPAGYDLRRTLDLVALGTVADVVPLIGENRLFVSKGLEALTHTQRPGLVALKKMATLENALKTSDIGFRMAPRLNASGRLDTAQASLDLLMATDQEDADMIAQELDDQNRQRQQLQLKVETEATAMLEATFDPARDGVVLIGSDQWHPGVVGIVAGKLCRRYQRPSFVVAFDATTGVGKGSGRGLEGVSLVKALHHASPHLIKGGGHELAAGLSVHRDQFAALRQSLSDHFFAQVGDRGFQTTLWIDTEVSLSELTLDFLDAYELLEPFGSEHHAPIFYCRKVRPLYDPRLCREKHWRLIFGSGAHKKSAMWFDSGHEPIPPGDLDIVFTIHRNRFRGQETLDLTILDIRSSR